MFVLCIINLISTVYGALTETAPNINDPSWVQQQAIDHVHTFLEEVQEDVKKSRDLIRLLHGDGPVTYPMSTPVPARISPKSPMLRHLSRYLLPTVAPGLLRTYYADAMEVVSHPSSPSTSFIKPREIENLFQDARDYVLPDFGPDYKDIFVPEVERQGDEDQGIAEAHDKVDSATTALQDVNMLFTAATPATDPGRLLDGMVATVATTIDPHPTLREALERDATGYFSVGLEHFLNLVATKEPDHVAAVLGPTELVVNNMTRKNPQKFVWMREPMSTAFHQIVTKFAPAISSGAIDVLQVRAKLLEDLMKNRKELLSDYVNNILDFADGMISVAAGERIFDVIDNFKNFPHTLKSGQISKADELCGALIDAFGAPFYPHSVDRQRLVNAANRAIRERFPHLNIFRRKATRGTKINGYPARHVTRIPKRYDISNSMLHTVQGDLKYGSHASTLQPALIASKQNKTKSSTIHKQEIRNRMYNNVGPIRYVKADNDYYKSMKKQSDNNNLGYFSNNKYKATKIINSKDIYSKNNNKSITNKKVMLTRNSYRHEIKDTKVTKMLNVKKATLKHKSFNIVTADRRKQQTTFIKQKIITKRVTSRKDTIKETSVILYPKSFRKANIPSMYVKGTNIPKNKIDITTKSAVNTSKLTNSNITNLASKLINKNQIKNLTSLSSKATKTIEIVNNDDSSLGIMNNSDEKILLNEKLLNNLLNVTSGESNTDQKPIDFAIETDDDEEVLNNLHEVLYNK